MRHNLVRLSSWAYVNYYRLMGVNIGKKNYISLHAHIDIRRGVIRIGNNVSISRGTVILSHTGYQAPQQEAETVIEDNVIIFVNSIIYPGVKIGRNSIVGAGSVVMKDVPPNVVVLGNPARVVQQLDPKKIESGRV